MDCRSDGCCSKGGKRMRSLFFFTQKTAYEMRISDWSSDVCSSDLGYFHVVFTLPAEIATIALQNKSIVYDLLFRAASQTMQIIAADPKIGRASGRERVCQYV